MQRSVFMALAVISVSSGPALAQGGAFPPPEPRRLTLESPAAPSSDQQIADQIGRAWRASASLRHYRLEVTCMNRIVDIYGEVTSAAQKAEAARIAQSAPGVLFVRDRSMIGGGILLAQAPGDPKSLIPDVPGRALSEPLSLMPMTVPPMPNPTYMQPPMPPYAWPTYAPYNNVSRVAYPNLYPYESWPYIGPMYPFPKVPPGWRSVTLRWQDGFWWYGRNATGHDWWRVRYW